MNDFIGKNYDNSEEDIKAKKLMKIIGVTLIFLLLVVIALICVIYYIKATELKIIVDGKLNEKLESVLVFEGEKVYVPIRAFASYVGYESYSGDHKQEDTTQCYVNNKNEETSFSLDSNKIYKKILAEDNSYEYYEIEEPVKMINEQLYTTIEGAKIAFNISMSYSKEKNTVTIYTLPYLVKFYTQKFQNAGIADKDANFNNQKALLYNMIIVKNANNYYGVYNLNGKEILGTKYKSIEFIESTKEFTVTTVDNKMGIISHDAKTKISPEYDQIKQIDKNNGLYLVTSNNKQGVVNQNGSTVIHLEYDQIGIDGTIYTDIKNQYLLYDKCIPVKVNNKWGLFDTTGKRISEPKYDDLGCVIGTTNIKNTNSLLLVPKYEGIVVKEGTMYGLIDSNGKTILPSVLTSMYSIITAGEESYHMIYNEQEINVISYIDEYLEKQNAANNKQ